MTRNHFAFVLALVAFASFGTAAHAQQKPAQIPGASASENRTVPGIVTSVQVDRILMTGPSGSGTVTFNVLVDSKTRIVKGQEPKQLSDITVGTNVTASGVVELRTLTMHADRIELPGTAAPAQATATPSVQAAAPAAQPPVSQGFWARLWQALFGWLKR